VPSALRLAARQPLPPSLPHAAWPMDDGSQAVALAALPPPGELVLDLCAGGGGKTRLLASRLAPGARVIAADISRPRLVRGVDGRAPAIVADGRAPPFRTGAFARVLVDAPCSGTGTLRRHPDLAHRLDPKDVPEFVALQRALLRAALGLVKRGGVVVYATCSVLREENEDVVNEAIALPGVSAQPLAALWGDAVRGVLGENGVAPDAWCVRLLPQVHGTDGFFVAALTLSAG
jgi:16S rRNA (cytosine967-C5)-methyltransferase